MANNIMTSFVIDRIPLKEIDINALPHPIIKKTIRCSGKENIDPKSIEGRALFGINCSKCGSLNSVSALYCENCISNQIMIGPNIKKVRKQPGKSVIVSFKSKKVNSIPKPSFTLRSL